MSAQDARDRFAAATAAHLLGPLTAGVEVRLVEDHAAWHAASEQLWETARDRPRLVGALPASEEQQARAADLGEVLAPPLAHRMLWYAGDEVVGAYWGTQEPYGRYYMVNSVVRKDWQGRGLYRAFLPRVIAACAEVGFAEIYSRHVADNNAVIVPKLRAGFVIAGFDVSPRHGLLVHLRYYLRESLWALYRHRVDGDAAELRRLGIEL
jgi:GNAT superfamily N-acetyltransferase